MKEYYEESACFDKKRKVLVKHKRISCFLTECGRLAMRALRSVKWIWYWTPWGYRAAKYWNARLGSYRFDLRGVGHKGLSSDQNRRDYEVAASTFLDLCRQDAIDIGDSKVLDVGCGTGFYCDLLRRQKVRDYTGVDITGTLFHELCRRFPECKFTEMDITRDELPDDYELIIMIDVTQHITDEKRFRWAMQNVRRHLQPGGVFIVTSWLSNDAKNTFYERSRPLRAYEREFDGCAFGEPMPFRDKFVFSIRPHSQRSARGES